MKIWYMRDNHTFRPLPLNVEAAIDTLRNEFDQGNTYGMLCSKEPALCEVVHAKDSWTTFEVEARKWLTSAAALFANTKPKPAYQFPTHLRKMWSGTEVQRWIDENIPKPVTREASEQQENAEDSVEEDVMNLETTSELRKALQQQCVDWNSYVRASDDHWVELTHKQATELLATALDLRVEIESATCTWCAGTGKFADHQCRFCNGAGTGSVFKEPKPDAPREAFLSLAQRCGATLTGKPDGSESITVVFTLDAWRAFDTACRPLEATGEPWNGHHFKEYPGGIWRCADEDCGYELQVSSEGKPGAKKGTNI